MGDHALLRLQVYRRSTMFYLSDVRMVIVAFISYTVTLTRKLMGVKDSQNGKGIVVHILF